MRFTLDPKLAIYKFFDNPFSAVNYLKEASKVGSFINRCLLRTEDDQYDHRKLDICISEIHKEIYNPQRFDQVSVVILDYSMPGLNGAQLSYQLKDRGFKIILLTGEASHTRAIELFNEGIIHYFVHKDDLSAMKLLRNAIVRLQYECFVEASELILNSITQKPRLFNQLSSCLDDSVFIHFFNSFKNENFTEYYLLDEAGSFLFLKEDGQMSWLIVTNEMAMEATEYDVRENATVSPAIKQAIESRSILRYVFNDREAYNYVTPEDWSRLIYPAYKINSNVDYYYSYIENPLTNPNIEEQKILSYKMYRKNLRPCATKI